MPRSKISAVKSTPDDTELTSPLGLGEFNRLLSAHPCLGWYSETSSASFSG